MQIVFTCFFAVCLALAMNPLSLAQEASQNCVLQAAQYHSVNAQVLNTILKQESNHQPLTVRRNTNGSVDVGVGGINSVHFTQLAKYGITPEHLLDYCVNTYVAAWHYARKVAKHGNTWTAVGAYHSETPHLRDAYARRIFALLNGQPK